MKINCAREVVHPSQGSCNLIVCHSWLVDPTVFFAVTTMPQETGPVDTDFTISVLHNYELEKVFLPIR